MREFPLQLYHLHSLHSNYRNFRDEPFFITHERARAQRRGEASLRAHLPQRVRREATPRGDARPPTDMLREGSPYMKSCL